MRNWLKNNSGIADAAGTNRPCSKGGRGRGLEVEMLEARMLLTGNPTLVQTDHMFWHGLAMDVRENSWVLTFDRGLGRAGAADKAREVAAFMGLTVDKIDTTALGRFANIVTRSNVTELGAAQAVSHFNYLSGVAPDRLSQLDQVPNDPRYAEQWALNNTGQSELIFGTNTRRNGLPGADMDAERAWNISTGSSRVVIAVIDSGMDIRHPDLRANVFSNPGEIPGNNLDDDNNGFIDDVNGWDFVGGQTGPDNDVADPVDPGHGTSVAGCIGAIGNNGIGVAGTAWNVTMLPLKIGGDGPGGLPNFAILAAFEYVTMMKTRFNVNIVATNNSYGALIPQDAVNIDPAEEIAIQESTDAGIICVVSAGNSSSDNDGAVRNYPASYPNPLIISVAATTNVDTLTSFSAYGHTTVDVGAPGEQVLTTEVGGGYRLIDGTSFSGPYTAGVVAMIASVNAFLTPAQIKATLLSSVDVVPALQGLVLTGGRVNLFKALLNSQPPGPLVTAITPGPQTAPVSEIHVAFNHDIVRSFFDAANAAPGGVNNSITLRRTNGDGRFDANDVIYDLNDPNVATVEFTARELIIHLAAPLPRDQHRIILHAGSFRDTGGLFLNGNVTSGNDETYDFNVVAFRGLFEPNDAISQATPLVLNASGAVTIPDITIGDGLYDNKDVDIFRVFATGPALITAQINARALAFSSTLDGYLRLFDDSGTQLAANDNFNGLDPKFQFFVPSAGQYYIGVSAFPNRTYLPTQPNTGVASSVTGSYELFVQVQPNATDAASRDNTTGINIPDTGSITSTITFTDGRSILDVNIRVNIAHTFVGDLRISLTGPGGQSVTLVNRRGGAGDNFTGTTFDDQAGQSIVAGVPPFAGGYRPETPLTGFNASSSAGTWTLRIEDLKAGDSGRLLSWGIDLTLANDVFGPFEVNDTTLVATDTGIDGAGSATFNAYLGDGAFGLRDVDLFRFVAGAGTTITALATPTTGSLDTILRLFDAAGNQISADTRQGSTASAITYVVANAGTYFLGVSGGNTTTPGVDGNTNYNPGVGGSGTVPTDATGAYTLVLNVAGGISEGALLLSGSELVVGVNNNGSIGFGTPTPSGAPSTGLRLGANDLLLRGGTLASYYGGAIDGFNILNSGDGNETDLAVSVANESDYSNRRAVVTGTFRNLGVRRVLSFGAGDRFIAVDVTLSNRSTSSINSLAWMEGFNPDQFYDGVQEFTRETVNNIRESTPRLATATSAGGGTTFALGAADNTPGVSAVVPGFAARGSIRDPFQVLNASDADRDPDPSGNAGAAGDLDLALTFNLGTLAPSGSKSFRYFIFADTSLQGVLNRYNAMNTGAAGGILAADPTAPTTDGEGIADLPYRVYYPEGYANDRVQTYLPIVNANSEAIRVVVVARYEQVFINGVSTLYPPDVLYDSASDEPGGKVTPNTRSGITLTTPALYAAGTTGANPRVFSNVTSQSTLVHRAGVRKNIPYAVEVRASAPVGAILSHYDRDISTGDSFSSTLNSQWLLGTGQKGPGVNDYITFYNPSASVVKVTVTAYPAGAGATGISIIQTLQPHRRGGWSVNDVAAWPAGSLSFKIDAEGPIVAALSHFDYNTHQGFGTLAQPGGGSTSGATGQGLFGVGALNETVSIVNPNAAAAAVTFTFSFGNGSSYRYTANVPPQRRGGFDLSSLVAFPVGQGYAVSYTSTQPVGVNLSSRTATDQEGSVLSPTASTEWLFAEGFRAHTLSDVHDNIRLYNPSALPTTVEIVMNYNNGESEVFRRTLPARAGVDVDTHDLFTGSRAGQIAAESFFGIKVQSAVPIIAWGSHFADYLGGGFGTLGTPLGTTGPVV